MKAKQIIFIRHGEKVNKAGEIEPVHLSENGFIRANELPNFFRTQRPQKINIPDIIFAMKQVKKSKDSSNRPIETITPLAELFKIPIVSNHILSEVDEEAYQISDLGHDKTALVCWEHKYMVNIAQILGAPVEYWGLDPSFDDDNGSDCFDAIWVLTRDANDDVHFDIFKQFSVSETGVISYDNVSKEPILSMVMQPKKHNKHKKN
jgi:hypothetical protein